MATDPKDRKDELTDEQTEKVAGGAGDPVKEDDSGVPTGEQTARSNLRSSSTE